MPWFSDFQSSFSRWLEKLGWRRNLHDDSRDKGGYDYNNEDDENMNTNSIQCYACTRAGVPIFHSTSCDAAQQPEWEASAGSYLVSIRSRSELRPCRTKRSFGYSNFGPFGRILDPRSKQVQNWNRAILLARGVSIAVDPLFFYVLSISPTGPPCLYMNGSWAAIVTVLRTSVDSVHLCHLWLQFRLAYVSRESLVVGCGKLVWDARAVASHYLKSFNGFLFDAFVILPIPQAVFWFIVPKLIKDQEQIELIMTLLQLFFLFQFLPKIHHSLSLMRRMQKVTGYIFGTIWWGFGLNLIAYLIASHVAGGYWYVLAIQRVASCLTQHCNRNKACNISLVCSKEICYKLLISDDNLYYPCGGNNSIAGAQKTLCLDVHGPFRYGIYEWAMPVITSNSMAVKILYPIFWGLMSLSTFGNDLEPTSHWLEIIFSIIIVLAGLTLFTLLIGNIQVFLHAVMANKRKMQLKCRDMEWWMRRRILPSNLRKRVRTFERQRWTLMGGEDEMDMIKDLPEGLRRDIKRHLCLDLIKKVPLFQSLDDLILDNICDRVRPLYYLKDEKIVREGDAVQRMVFIVRGRIKSSQNLSKGMVATSILEPGGFLGDELLSWCLRRPFLDRLPASSATFVSTEATEAFGLEANHLKYITDHFRYKFANEKLKRTARYYSSNWRTWAAVNIQFAWRRFTMRTRGDPVIRAVENGENGRSERRLLQYAAMFMSIKPHDHLE